MPTTPQKSELLATAEFDFVIAPLVMALGVFDVFVQPRLHRYSRKHEVDINYAHVESCLEKGIMTLGLVYKQGKLMGCVLYHGTTDNFTGRKGMHIDFCHFDPDKSVFEWWLTTLDELVAHFGYAFVTAQTQRAGFGTRDIPGWSEHDRLWRKEYGRW